MSDGNRRDNAALDHFVGQFAWRPVRHWPPRFVGRFAGHREDLRDLFGRELAAATGTPQIAERFRNGLAQGGWFLGALDERQPVEGFLPTFPPDADAVPLAVEFLGDFFVAALSDIFIAHATSRTTRRHRVWIFRGTVANAAPA